MHLNDMKNANARQEETTTLLSLIGVKDLQKHFKIRKNKRWTWEQKREGRYEWVLIKC